MRLEDLLGLGDELAAAPCRARDFRLLPATLSSAGDLA